MMQIAVYGKGGIGKSTISSNLSLGLSQHQMKVMQIGCDPKHDSTRLLMSGEAQTTVLDYIRDTNPSDRTLDDLIKIGTNGVLCVEAGGPEPGIGCAGRGILTTFALLNELGIKEIPTDICIYDVLGDVVCGGFAVPLRKEYSDIIYIVTSGEFMSIYAANNILKGILNFGSDVPRVAGIIFNERGMECEKEFIKNFSEAVGIPIISSIPRCREFAEAESNRKTVLEMFPDSEASKAIETVVANAINHYSSSLPLFFPKPLNDEQLNDLAARRKIRQVCLSTNKKIEKCNSENTGRMKSCAARGASYELSRITDVPILIHGPGSCGYVMGHTQDLHYLETLKSNNTFNITLKNNIFCTDMDENSVIFGGNEALSKKLNTLINSGEKEIFIITTCVSGMIGDDIAPIVKEICNNNPDVSISTIKCDGNMMGDSDAGRIAAINMLLDKIDENVSPDADYVNLVDNLFMKFNNGSNLSWTMDLLNMFNLKLNCELLGGCSLDELKNAKKAALNILVEEDPVNSMMVKIMKSKGMRFFTQPLPCGYRSTISWIRMLCKYLEIQESDMQDRISEINSKYQNAVNSAKEILSGKHVILVSRSGENIDWIIESLIDAETKIFKNYQIGFDTHLQQHSIYSDTVDFMLVSYAQMLSELKSIDQDIIVVSSFPLNLKHRICRIPSDMVSHQASIKFLNILKNIVRCPLNEGWKTEVKYT